MKNTDNHMNIDDYTRIVNQLRSFTNKDDLAPEDDAGTFAKSDLDDKGYQHSTLASTS